MDLKLFAPLPAASVRRGGSHATTSFGRLSSLYTALTSLSTGGDPAACTWNRRQKRRSRRCTSFSPPSKRSGPARVSFRDGGPAFAPTPARPPSRLRRADPLPARLRRHPMRGRVRGSASGPPCGARRYRRHSRGFWQLCVGHCVLFWCQRAWLHCRPTMPICRYRCILELFSLCCTFIANSLRCKATFVQCCCAFCTNVVSVVTS